MWSGGRIALELLAAKYVVDTVSPVIGAAVDDDDVGRTHSRILYIAGAEVLSVPVLIGIRSVGTARGGSAREGKVGIPHGI